MRTSLQHTGRIYRPPLLSSRRKVIQRPFPSCDNVPIGEPILLTNKRHTSLHLDDGLVCPAISPNQVAEGLGNILKTTQFSVAEFLSSSGCRYIMVIVGASAFASAVGAMLGSVVGQDAAVSGQDCLNLREKTVLTYDSETHMLLPARQLVCTQSPGVNISPTKGSIIGMKFGALAGAFIGIRLSVQMFAAMLADPTSPIHLACISKECLAGIAAVIELGTGAMFGKVIEVAGIMNDVQSVDQSKWIEFGVINDMTNAMISVAKSVATKQYEGLPFMLLFGIFASAPVGLYASRIHADTIIHKSVGLLGGLCYGIILVIYQFVASLLFWK